jgi:peptide/nickel transport system permease protein
MALFLLRRLLQAAFTLLLLSIVIFVLARSIGDPILFMLPVDAAAEDIERLRIELGFDQPLGIQYLQGLWGMLQGDFGVSLRKQTPVADLIMDRLPASALLVGVTMAWAFLASVLLGVAAAVYRESLADRSIRFLVVLAQSAPAFWVAILFIQIFSVQLQWLPSGGSDDVKSLMMPAATLGLFVLAGLTRLTRSSMINVLDSDYILKARVMGTPEYRVVWRHGFRNASLPVVTFAGEYVGLLVTSAVTVETIFSWPGLGQLAYEAVFTRDYPLMQGVTLTVAALVMAVNLAVDAAYAYLDPRVRLT